MLACRSVLRAAVPRATAQGAGRAAVVVSRPVAYRSYSEAAAPAEKKTAESTKPAAAKANDTSKQSASTWSKTTSGKDATKSLDIEAVGTDLPSEAGLPKEKEKRVGSIRPIVERSSRRADLRNAKQATSVEKGPYSKSSPQSTKAATPSGVPEPYLEDPQPEKWESGLWKKPPAPATVSKSSELSFEEQEASRAVDWSSGYYGIATKPVTAIQHHRLMAPLSPFDVEVKPDGIIYLPEIKYRRRLNAAFGPMGWGMIPRGDPVVGQTVVTREYALIVGGRFVAQAQGENGYFSAEQLPSAVEGCKSNALMRCCKDLGVASELWDPAYIRWFRQNHMEAAWGEHATTGKKKQLWFRKGEVIFSYPYKASKL